jgi:hypothetical protein
MSAPPERPCDDIGGLNAFSRETFGQFEVAPVVQSRSFGSGTGRQTPPVRSSPRLCDLLGGGRDEGVTLRPRLYGEGSA